MPENQNELEGIKIIFPLEHLSKFILNLDTLLINCKIELILKWSKNCVLTSQATRTFKAGPPALAEVPTISVPSDLKFNITDCKLYVPVVALQSEYENKLYEQLKTGFTMTVEWNKYTSQVLINQQATNNLNYLIDPTFNNVGRLFILAFENEEDRSSFSKYYKPTVEIKDYNVLIDQKPFYEMPIKSKEEAYKAITELVRNDDYMTGNLLDFGYHGTYYKLIEIDLNRQDIDLKNQQINIIGKLQQEVAIFVIIEDQQQTSLKFLQNSLTIV